MRHGEHREKWGAAMMGDSRKSWKEEPQWQCFWPQRKGRPAGRSTQPQGETGWWGTWELLDHDASSNEVRSTQKVGGGGEREEV